MFITNIKKQNIYITNIKKPNVFNKHKETKYI